MFKWSVGVLAVLALILKSNMAYPNQKAEVSVQDAEVHQAPLATSPVLGKLKLGLSLVISSSSVADASGQKWFKTKYNSVIAYVAESSLKLAEAHKEATVAHVQPVEKKPEEETSDDSEETDYWNLRFMGMLGRSLRTGGIIFGTDFEISHEVIHLISLGAAFMESTGALGSVFAVSGIFELPFHMQGRDPEIRLRYGFGGQAQLAVGFRSDLIGPLGICAEVSVITLDFGLSRFYGVGSLGLGLKL